MPPHVQLRVGGGFSAHDPSLATLGNVAVRLLG